MKDHASRSGIARRGLALAALAGLLALSPRLDGLALQPEPVSPLVGQIVTTLLEQAHYARRPVDDATSRQMLRNYIEFFDYGHMILEQSDVAQFEALYGDALDDLLKMGDVAPAFAIFDRITQRLEERVEFIKTLTRSTLTFTTDETFALERAKAPWPASAEEADALWSLRVRFEILQERLNGASPEDQIKTVSGRYERLLRTLREYDSDGVVQAYLTALAHAYDPHSEYMAEAQTENFNISMRLSLVGIGASLRSEEGYAKIVALIPGGPAEADGRLKANDRIEAVAQGDGPLVEVMGMNLDRVVQLIRGKKGTTVRLRVIPADALEPSTRVIVALVRDEVKLTEQEAKAKILTVPPAAARGTGVRVGVIDLPSFYADKDGGASAKSTTRDVERLLAKLKADGIDGLILDLRRNGGGSLSEAVALTGLFIPQGPVVQVKDSRGAMDVLEDPDPRVAYPGPMVVLTSRGSASASEILAGALQDYGRAVVVGEKSTFGKGTVQAVIGLAQYLPPRLRAYKPGSLKLTIQKFYRVSGGSTQSRGVIADIRLPALSDESDFSEASQKNALPYDEVEPARFQRLDSVTPLLPGLQKASAARVAASREFAHVREDIELYKKQAEAKVGSLNEKKRLQEKQAQEARATERKKERLARKETLFVEGPEITLSLLDGKPARPKPPAPKKPAKPAKPSKDGDDEEDYEKAPPAPDFVLHEAASILSDIVPWQILAPPSGSAQRAPGAGPRTP
ncbi:MAG: carboxy terminal-processing peptidase [Elusimicrobia bacterium]|nr:carboxy terminal-processing peptidase [Elusimicrobiota bacterium]